MLVTEREYGLQYVSPAGYEAALVPVQETEGSIVFLPFRWATVDAYYYMETFSKLREIKGEPEEPQTVQRLTERVTSEIDDAIARGGYLSVLFHPFLNNSPERLQAFEAIVSYLASKRDEGTIWLAKCEDVQKWVQEHPDIVGSEPDLDETQWR